MNSSSCGQLLEGKVDGLFKRKISKKREAKELNSRTAGANHFDYNKSPHTTEFEKYPKTTF